MKLPYLLRHGRTWLAGVLLLACSASDPTPNADARAPDGGSSAEGVAGSGASAGSVGAPAGDASGAASAATNQSDAATPGALKGSQAEQVLQSGCATSTVQSTLLPANLLLVLDRSGSMVCNPPPTTDSTECERAPARASAMLPNKWEITSTALQSAIQTLPASVKVGVGYFSNDGVCGVNAEPSVELAPVSSAHLADVAASLGAVTPQGGTPLVGGVILAYRHLHDLGLQGKISGNTFVVLLTDGGQSAECSNPPVCTDVDSCYDLLLKQEVPKAAGPGVGIRTFVIGAPGSEPARSVLSQIAKLGGTAVPGCDVAMGNCHFDMSGSGDFGKSLSAALRSIVGEVISCELNLPSPEAGGAADPNAVNVVYTPSTGSALVVPQDTSVACDGGAEGWQYTDGTNTKIRLCGKMCDAIRADEGGRVDVVLGCPVVLL